MKIDCTKCNVAAYCGTMVSSIRLCRSIHKKEEDENNRVKCEEHNSK